MIQAALKAVDGLNVVGAAGAALAFALLSVMLIVEVVATSFLAWSQPWAVEYSTYFLALTLFLGSGWTLRTGGHIRVSILLALLPERVARLLDLFGSAFALGVVSFAAWALVGQALRTAEIGSVSYFPSRTPLVYPQALLAAGFVLLVLAFLARVVRLVLGHPAEVPYAALPADEAAPEDAGGRG